jgi:hypothetical protein
MAPTPISRRAEGAVARVLISSYCSVLVADVRRGLVPEGIGPVCTAETANGAILTMKIQRRGHPSRLQSERGQRNSRQKIGK